MNTTWFNRFWHGAAYYPELWKNKINEDLRLMQNTGINIVRIAEFAWSAMEPEEGRYNWSWLDDSNQRRGSWTSWANWMRNGGDAVGVWSKVSGSIGAAGCLWLWFGNCFRICSAKTPTVARSITGSRNCAVSATSATGGRAKRTRSKGERDSGVDT